MAKKFKVLVLFIIVVAGLFMATFQNRLPIDYFIYWHVLIVIALVVWILQLGSQFTLWAAFILFFMSAFTVAIDSQKLGEVLMRLSLISWMVGLTQSLLELKKRRYL